MGLAFYRTEFQCAPSSGKCPAEPGMMVCAK